jgi:hypothetical protein
VELVEKLINWQHLRDSAIQEVRQLEATQMLDACYYSLVVVVIELATYLPLPYFGQTERRPSY